MIKIKTHYEVHRAKSNYIDKIVSFRVKPNRHETRLNAEMEARIIKPNNPKLVPIVCEVKYYGKRSSK